MPGSSTAPFAGRVAIVTGGASGIGRELCRALAARRAIVVVADLDAAGAERVAAELGAPAEAAALDVTDDAAVGALVDRVAARHGHLDLMFNNAGIGIGADARDYALEDWRRVLDVNVHGVVHGSRHALRVMAAQGTGHIVNTASAAGLMPFPTNVPYATSKHAVVGLGRSLRVEGSDLGVRVTTVCPGFVQTAILDSPLLNVDPERVRGLMTVRPLEAVRAAELILRGVAANRSVVVFPRYVYALLALDRVLPWIPRAVERRLVRRFRSYRTAPPG